MLNIRQKKKNKIKFFAILFTLKEPPEVEKVISKKN